MAKIERTKHDIYPFISPLHSLQGAAAGKTVLVTGGGKGLGKVRLLGLTALRLKSHR